MTDAEWTPLRRRTDPKGMAAYAAISPNASQDSKAGRLHFLHEIDRIDDGHLASLPADLPPAMRTLFEDTAIPEWLKRYGDVAGMQQTACTVFHDDVVSFVIALLCKSLTECYAGERGAKVLAYTGVLGEPNYNDPGVQDTMVRRVVETAVFLRNMHRHEMWHGADPVAVRTIHKVRIFHCGVRTMIERRHASGIQQWDEAYWGVPINQADMLATNVAFSLQAIRGARKLGARISAEDERSIMVHWARIGYHLGIDEDLLTWFIEKPADVWDMVARNEFAPSEHGFALTSAMVKFLQNKVFFAVTNAHLPELFMRKLMDPKAVTAVHLERLPKVAAQPMVVVVSTIMLILHSIILRIPGVGKRLLDMIGSGIVEITVAEWAGDRNPWITLSKELEGA